jgi:uncharacterized glyoxalase superfamily metalloenzyme YdcJ
MTKFVDRTWLRAEHLRWLVPRFSKGDPMYNQMFELSKAINIEGVQSGKISQELKRLIDEFMHSALRCTPKELPNVLRVFKVMAALSFECYDLRGGVGVISTYVRAFTEDELRKNGYRAFISCIDLDHMMKEYAEKLRMVNPDDPDIDKKVKKARVIIEKIIAARDVFSPKMLELLDAHDTQGGLDESQAKEFLEESMNLFLRPKRAAVSLQTYYWLLGINKTLAHVLVSPVLALNHITPCVYSVHAAHLMMHKWGIRSIDVTQGPPQGWEILLNQVSCLAPSVNLWFLVDDGFGIPLSVLPKQLRWKVSLAKFFKVKYVTGEHQETFVEFEARYLSLTPKGFDLYDKLLNGAKKEVAWLNATLKLSTKSKQYRDLYYAILEKWFEAFPNTEREQIAYGLGYFRYRATEKGKAAKGTLSGKTFLELYDEGYIEVAERLLYPGFLILSATGIFVSNLGLKLKEVAANNIRLLVELLDLYAEAPDQAIFEALEEPVRKKSDAQIKFEQWSGEEVKNGFHLHKLEQWKSIVYFCAELELDAHDVTGVAKAT